MQNLYVCHKCNRVWNEDMLLEDIDGLTCGDAGCGGTVERLKQNEIRKERKQKEARRINEEPI